MFDKIYKVSHSHIVYPGLKFKDGQEVMEPEEIPGLVEAGWTKEMKEM